MIRKALEIKEVTAIEMAEILSNLKNYKGFITLVAETEQNSKLTKPVANFGKDVIITKVEKIMLNFGGDYQSKMQKVLNDENFESQKPFGRHHFNNSDYVLQSDKDERKFYLRTYPVNSFGMKRRWDTKFKKNGCLIEDINEIERIKSLYRPIEPKPIMVLDYSINNVICARVNRIDYIIRNCCK